MAYIKIHMNLKKKSYVLKCLSFQYIKISEGNKIKSLYFKIFILLPSWTLQPGAAASLVTPPPGLHPKLYVYLILP